MKVTFFLKNNSKTTCFIILALSGIILFAGCKKNISNNQPKKRMYYVATAFVEDNPKTNKPLSLKDKRWNQRVYGYNKNKSFNGYYYIENGLPKKTKYRVLSFINYKQSTFYFDNKKNNYADFYASANSSKYFPYRTKSLDTGYYNFLNVTIWASNKHPNERKRFAVIGRYFSARRATFIVNKAKPVEPIYEKLDKLKSNKVNFKGIIINKSKSLDLRYWFKENVKPESKVNFNVVLGNSSSKPLKTAVIALLDFKQIAMSKDLVKFIELNPKSITSFPVSINLTNKKGIHELLLLRIDKPFNVIDENESLQHELVRSSSRTAIVVE